MAKVKASGKRPVGRPKAQVDEKQVKALAAMGYTEHGIAAALGVARSTLTANFRTALLEGRAVLENSILAKQVERALAGDPSMLKWVGIQRCGQRSQIGLSGPDGGPVEVKRMVKVDL